MFSMQQTQTLPSAIIITGLMQFVSPVLDDLRFSASINVFLFLLRRQSTCHSISLTTMFPPHFLLRPVSSLLLFILLCVNVRECCWGSPPAGSPISISNQYTVFYKYIPSPELLRPIIISYGFPNTCLLLDFDFLFLVQ